MVARSAAMNAKGTGRGQARGPTCGTVKPTVRYAYYLKYCSIGGGGDDGGGGGVVVKFFVHPTASKVFITRLPMIVFVGRLPGSAVKTAA